MKLTVLVGVPVLIVGLAAGSAVRVDAGGRTASFQERDTEHVWPSGMRAAPGPVPAALPVRAGPAMTPSRVVSVGRSFPGLSSDVASGDPPDPVIGVGAGFVVQMVNSVVRIWTADGVARADYPLASFAGASSTDVSDPRVVFDPDSGRWFASVVDVARATVQLAVSGSSDPTGPWTVYSHATGNCPDQPSLGIGGNLVVVAYGAYSLPCRSDAPPAYLGGALYVYDKQQLVDDGEARPVDWGPRLDFSPITAVSPTDGTIAVALVAPLPTGGPTYLEILNGRRSTGAAPAAPTLTITRLVIDPLAAPPGAEQAGTTQLINTNDDRILSAVTNAGTLWLAGNDGCLPPRDTRVRSCLRIIAVKRNRIALDTDLSSKGQDFFYPALAPDGDGDLVVVHGTSSRAAYPGLSALAITPAGRPTRAVTVAAGAGPVLSDRFGDYFGAATDASGQVWITGETSAVPSAVLGPEGESPSNWATTVASVTTRLPSG